MTNATRIGADIPYLTAPEGPVSLSGDGTRVAVSACASYVNADFSDCDSQGRLVRVFEWRCDARAWRQVGDNITESSSVSNSFGRNIKLSHDGTRLAVSSEYSNGQKGHVAVFEWTPAASSWFPLGDAIVGKAGGDVFGESLALSGDGARVAVMSPRNNGNGQASGSVRVFEWSPSGQQGAWTKIGQDLDGEAANNYGGGVSLSRDGEYLAAGHYYNSNRNGDEAGHVRVWRLTRDGNGDATWTQVGEDIDGPGEDAKSGGREAVSLSADGATVAVGAFQHGSHGDARVYRRNDAATTPADVWRLVGGAMDDSDEGSRLGNALSISADGNRLAVLTRSSGFALRVYDWDALRWARYPIQDDDFPGGGHGGHVALSSDGSRVAISGHTTGVGKFARVYELDADSSTCSSTTPGASNETAAANATGNEPSPNGYEPSPPATHGSPNATGDGGFGGSNGAGPAAAANGTSPARLPPRRPPPPSPPEEERRLVLDDDNRAAGRASAFPAACATLVAFLCW